MKASTLSSALCPACGGALGAMSVLLLGAVNGTSRASADAASSTSSNAAAIRCTRCSREFARDGSLIDLRLDASAEIEPWPLARGDLDRTFERARGGAAYRALLEALLLELPDERAEPLMLLLREARGSWFPLLRARGGELLLIGNALSGTVTPLTDAGFRVTVVDRSSERARFARIRNDVHSPGRTETVICDDLDQLPFADASFDVVVEENGLRATRQSRHARAPSDSERELVSRESQRSQRPSDDDACADLAECRRVSRNEVVLIADNRLGYKRSSGRRGQFRVPSPFEYVGAAIAPRRGERTLHGYRRAFARAGCARTRAFSLYPHAQDFSHVVALDESAPALTIGPMERKNRWKLAARAIGLFPVLTPSFAIIGERVERAGRDASHIGNGSTIATRIERMLAEIAERIGEPAPRIEQLVSTRGNSAIVHTHLPGEPASEPRGRWTLHLPLAPKNIPQCERHFRMLELLRARFPSVPAPEPLFIGRADGVSVTCERRARGWTAPQRAGDARRIERMLRDTAEHFAALVVRAAAPLTEGEFAEQVSARFAIVAQHAAVPSTIASLARMHDELRERLVGQKIARVVYHADLRAKHVQIDADGRVTAYLDWGTAEHGGLPYQDLLQLIVHERKQEAGLSAAEAWKLVRDRERLRDYERESLESYARAVGLDDETCRASELMYPVLVAAMAEKNWEYSRPRWLHRQFGL